MIRLLPKHEIPLLLPGARAFYAEGNLMGRLNETHVVRALGDYLDLGVGFVLVDGQAPFRGSIGGVIVPDFATGDLTCMEFYWYVHEAERGSVGLRLIRAFEAEAKKRGAKRILMMCLMGANTDQISRFYERCGYTHREKMFAKEVA